VPTAPISRLLELAPLRFIGKLSYSLYIWQQLFLGDPNGSAMSVLTGIAAALRVRLLSYRFVEQPCIRVGRRLIAARATLGTGRLLRPNGPPSAVVSQFVRCEVESIDPTS